MSIRYDIASITFYDKNGDIEDVISGFRSLEFVGKKRIKITYDNGNIEIFKIKNYESIFIQV